jgi:hypothetical protein
VAWRRRRARALDLAVLQAETAQLQVEALRAELSDLHHAAARRDIELLSVLSRLTAASDRLNREIEAGRTETDRLSRSIERLALLALAPPVPAPAPGAAGAGTVIGGTVDPRGTVDLTESATLAAERPPIDLTTDLPIAPATLAEAPLECEVHLQFGDRWIDGFQIEETLRTSTATKFRIRRRVDGWVLPELFDESEIRVFTRPVVE